MVEGFNCKFTDDLFKLSYKASYSKVKQPRSGQNGEYMTDKL